MHSHVTKTYVLIRIEIRSLDGQVTIQAMSVNVTTCICICAVILSFPHKLRIVIFQSAQNNAQLF